MLEKISGVALLERDRELLGHLVRQIWVAWVKEQPDAKQSWLVTCDGCGKEANGELTQMPFCSDCDAMATRVAQSAGPVVVHDAEPVDGQPFLGQRCDVPTVGFGTIIALKFGGDGKVHARVQCDSGLFTWRKVSNLELLASTV